MVFGGLDASGEPLASAELFDPAGRPLGPTGSATFSRTAHSAVLLQDGRVLVGGGRGTSRQLVSAELFE
jgi:hypothetical protein